jgi:hypothetical protein
MVLLHLSTLARTSVDIFVQHYGSRQYHLKRELGVLYDATDLKCARTKINIIRYLAHLHQRQDVREETQNEVS